MPVAEYLVEVDFNNAVGGAAVFQDTGGTFSTFADDPPAVPEPSQTFARSVTDTFGGAYADVTRDVVDVTIRRGRDDTGGTYGPGEATVTLLRPISPDDDVDAPGGRELYNPASTQSPLSPAYTGSIPPKEEPGISPLRPLRITMTYNGQTRILFYGWITTWRFDRATGRTRVIAKDLLWRLSKSRPAFEYQTGETTSSAIGRILDDARWTAPDDRNLNPTIQGVSAGVGDVLPLDSLEPDGEQRTGLQVIDELLEVNNGWFYVRGKDAVYENRTARSLRRNVEHTLNDVAVEFDPGFDVE